MRGPRGNPGSYRDPIHEYDAAGVFISDFANITGGPLQLIEAADGNVFVATATSDQRDILEYQSDGAFVMEHAPSPLDGFLGVFELGNGNLLITTAFRLQTELAPSGSVFEIDRSGQIVDTKIARLIALFIEFAKLDADGDGVGDDLDNCSAVANADQADGDSDGAGDVYDNCPANANSGQGDGDGNGIGDVCEPPPAAQLAMDDCCGGGMDGMMMPMTLLGMGWLRRRARRRRT